METKFATLDPLSGGYSLFSSEDEAIAHAAKKAFDLYISHTHGNPVSKVSIDANGAETWCSITGEPFGPTHVGTHVGVVEGYIESFLQAERMAVTKLGDE